MNPVAQEEPLNKERDMKTLNYVVSSVAVAFALTLSAEAQQAPQRAAANAFEMRNRAPRTADSAQPTAPVVDLTPIRGKHAMQVAESRRAVSSERGLDIAHAPRPITAGKDPDLERKWRENAKKFQVAPVK